MSGISIAKSLELHLLRPLITMDEVRIGCEQAALAHLAAVAVWPTHVALATEQLSGTDLRVRAAIGFPYGQEAAPVKLAGCDRALADGADELAVMLDHSSIAAGELAPARRELDSLLEHAWWSALTAARGRADLTVVLEATMLDIPALAPLLDGLHDSAAGFVQTGSGHQPRAVTEQHVRALRETLPPDVGIVAVGGVAELRDAEALVVAGAVRVGSGSAVAILEQERHARHARQST